MSYTERLTCVISGSFKFKPEIDEAYDELGDNGIDVLSPEKGWLYLPPHRRLQVEDAGTGRPLPTEQGMTLPQIETSFLRELGRASFVYLMNVEGYMGVMTHYEIGHALGYKKPLYAHQPLGAMPLNWDGRRSQWDFLAEQAVSVPIPDIAEDFHKRNDGSVS